jgi:gliding motility-associated-like protein
VVAPYGYQQYRWFNSTFTQVLGTSQTLHLSPPPPPGTTLAVEVVPYNGFGCLDTLFAQMIDTLHYLANAGVDGFSCNKDPVPIGVVPKTGWVYQWTPATGLSNPGIANPWARPDVTTNYILTLRSSGGGCRSTDSVLVKASVINNTIKLIGSAAFCINSEDSAILQVQPTDSIQWYRDGIRITGANKTQYKVLQSGSYIAMLFNKDGCRIGTEQQPIVIDNPTPPVRYPLQYAVVDIPVTLKARKFGQSVLWTPASYLDNRASVTPLFKGPSDQLYTIEIKTASGCVTVDTQMVKTVDRVDVLVPTAFTPNKDGRNDYLRPILIGVRELRYFRIFNRWGQVLFVMKDDDSRGWDGQIKGVVQDTQVVVWMVECMGLDGKVHLKKGTSALIR